LIVVANAASICGFLLIYFSESALRMMVMHGNPSDLNNLALTIFLVLLFNDLFTAGFLYVLRHQIRNIKKKGNRQGKDPIKKQSPRKIESAKQFQVSQAL
jgi:hypothetical protein